jgi:cysteine desulfurase
MVYLDYNASSPCDPRVVEAMLPHLSDGAANPSSRHHRPGQDAAATVDRARAALAHRLGAASANEITFTSGATEANNLALLGLARARQTPGHIISQVTEHPSVLAPLEHLVASGWEVTVLGVDSAGLVRPAELERALRPDTVAVSLMLANNETGAIQPVAEVAALLGGHQALLHCDAAQAAGKLDIDLATLAVDLLTLSGHKMCGPKGVGALYLRRRSPPVRLAPLLHGGGQECGLRPGTVPVPLVAGLVRALEITIDERDQEAARVSALRDRLESTLVARLDGVTRNGPAACRLPGTCNLSFAGVDGTALLMSLRDLAVSTGSACTADHPEPSPVLRAMGVPRCLAAASLRFGLGRFTTGAEIELAIDRVVEEVTRLRSVHRGRTGRSVRE